jgi:hypothetical protein
MRYPKYFVATQDFTLNEPRPPRVRDGLVVELLWRYVDVDKGDLVKYCGGVHDLPAVQDRRPADGDRPGGAVFPAMWVD